MPIERDAMPAPREALAGLLALLLAPDGRTPAQLIERLAAVDAFARLGLDPRYVALRMDQVLQEAGTSLCDRSWLQDGDRARVDRMMAPILDPAVRTRLCEIAAAVLGEDDSVSHSRCQVLDHVVSGWHVALPHGTAHQG